jgi:pyridoxine kinase
MNNVPKIVAINDISGVGRCSMTVIVPILSALGCQVCPMPTAILSNHSEYDEFYFYDFTDHMKEYYDAWEKNGIDMDCIYSGFIGSERQIDIILGIIKKSKEMKNTLVVVDPVMGDHGKTYKTYTVDMVKKMSALVEKADIITPNLTEVSILLGEEYNPGAMSIETVKSYLYRLSLLGPVISVITGITTDEGEHINVCYDSKNDEYWKIPFDFIESRYPGTGDLFTSLLIGYIFNGKKLPEAIELSSKFVSSSVGFTQNIKTPKREGVAFEKIIKELFVEIYEYNYSRI